MYIPAVNREDDVSELRQFIRAHPFCTLVSMTGAGLVASHLPVVLHEDGAGFGVLRGHLARGNSQWRDFDPDVQALAVFTGPQHFISASWYPGVGREVVPTWNYVAVHAYGFLRVIEDRDWLLTHLRALVDEHERIASRPWSIADAPGEYIAREMRGIAGIELEVARVEGKWKVSQNRNQEDAAGVTAGLASLGTPAAEVMSELVRKRRPR